MSAKTPQTGSDSKLMFWKKSAPAVPGKFVSDRVFIFRINIHFLLFLREYPDMKLMSRIWRRLLSLVVVSGSTVASLSTPSRKARSIREFDQAVDDAWDDDIDDDVAAVAKSFRKFSIPEPSAAGFLAMRLPNHRRNFLFISASLAPSPRSLSKQASIDSSLLITKPVPEEHNTTNQAVLAPPSLSNSAQSPPTKQSRSVVRENIQAAPAPASGSSLTFFQDSTLTFLK